VVAPCANRAGNCLQQALLRKPIDWQPAKPLTPEPTTIIGDSDWVNYQVSVDVHLNGAAYVSLLGRVGTWVSWTKRPDSYELAVRDNGNWELNTHTNNEKTVLTSGKVGFPNNPWHRLALRFQESRIQAFIDDRAVGAANDGNHLTGMVGVGTDYAHAQFDNLSVQAVP
jgi:galactosylceramidase